MRHRFHALCPYFAMFPEAFVEKWLGKLTKPGETILDPFCGRGTAPFQALLSGRNAIGNDVNPVAFCITKAKTNAPAAAQVHGRITLLANKFDPEEWEATADGLPEFFQHAYARPTLLQLLYLRSRLRWHTSDVDAMVAALTLGALHGESHRSPSYLSNQMPRTISTKPAYSVRYWKSRGLVAPTRDAFRVLHVKADYRYQSHPPTLRAAVLHGDMRLLTRSDVVTRTAPTCAITSPPYLDVTDFEEDQWLRLWFLNREPYPTRHVVSRDDRYRRPADYWSLIGDMWRVLGVVLGPKANVVIRIGGKGLTDQQLVDGLEGTSVLTQRRVKLVSQEVSSIQGRQTGSFRPGSTGCLYEVDCHFRVA